MKTNNCLPAVLEIDSNKLSSNLKKIKSMIQKSEILAMLKGNAYGIGLENVASILIREGIKFFGVVGIVEATSLRTLSKKITILNFEPIMEEKIESLLKKKICPIIYKPEDISILAKSDLFYKQGTSVYLKVNTGLNRWGLSIKEAVSVAEELSKFTKVTICGLITTLIEDKVEDVKQINTIEKLQNELKKRGITIPQISYASSQYILSTSDKKSNLTRLGISLCGVYPDNETQKNEIVKLDQVFNLKTHISQTRIIKANESVLYKKRLVVNRSMKIGILPIGYYLGLSPLLKNQGSVLINNQFCPILGISMSSTVVDITRVKKIISNQEVILLGQQGGKRISIYDWERWTGISRYVLMSGLSYLLPRKYIG